MEWKQKKEEGARLHFSIFSEGSLGLCKSTVLAWSGNKKREKAPVFTFLFSARVHWDYVNPVLYIRYKIVLEKWPLPLYLQKK